MPTPPARHCQSLNGKWAAIVDPYDQGVPKEIFLNRKPQNDTEFFEYAFEGGLRLEVPGDWNSQSPELDYYEGTVWYARHLLVGDSAPQLPEGPVPRRSRHCARANGSSSTSAG